MPECQRAGATAVEPQIWCCLALHLFPKYTVTAQRDLVLHQNVVASTKEWKWNWLAAVSGTDEASEQSVVAPAQDVESQPSGASKKTARFCFLQNLESLVAFKLRLWFWKELYNVAACDGSNIMTSRLLDTAISICSCMHMPTHNSLFLTATAPNKAQFKIKEWYLSCPAPLKRHPLKGCCYFNANEA